MAHGESNIADPADSSSTTDGDARGVLFEDRSVSMEQVKKAIAKPTDSSCKTISRPR